jgi:hypothetical protein
MKLSEDYFIVSDKTEDGDKLIDPAVKNILYKNLIPLDLSAENYLFIKFMKVHIGLAKFSKWYGPNNFSELEINEITMNTILNTFEKLRETFIHFPEKIWESNNLLYKNITGVMPDAKIEASYMSMIEDKTVTQEWLTLLAANLELNKLNINLVGLSKTGIEFTPLVT